MRLISSKVVVWAMAAGISLAALPVWAEPKIGIVDAQRLLEESPQGKAVQESMRAEFAPRQRTLQAQEQALKAKVEKLQKDAATMSEDQRQRTEKELRDGQRDFERARQEFQDDISARRNEEMSRLQRTLGEEVRTYAKANNFDLVFSAEVVIFATPTYDVTPGVLAAMQAHGGGASAGKPAATPGASPPQGKPPTK